MLRMDSPKSFLSTSLLEAVGINKPAVSDNKLRNTLPKIESCHSKSRDPKKENNERIKNQTKEIKFLKEKFKYSKEKFKSKNGEIN